MKRRKKREREDDSFDEEAYINEMLYNEGNHSPKPQRKPRGGVFLGILTFVLGIGIIGFAFLLLFSVQTIEVQGTKHSTGEEVMGWIKKDKLAVNSAYVWWKYNRDSTQQLPMVESTEVTLKNPWTVIVTVKEKDISGYIQVQDKYLYFDKDGTALLKTDKIIDKVPHIEGMNVEDNKVEVGKALPVSDRNVFKRIVEISRLIEKYHLTPDRIVCVDSELNLYFGKVEVLLGTSNYDDRLAQVPPIFEKLHEQFPDKEGTLHLENFGVSEQSVRFTPKENQEEEGAQDLGEEQTQ